MYSLHSKELLSSAVCHISISTPEQYFSEEVGTGFAIAVVENRVLALTAQHVIADLINRAVEGDAKLAKRRNLARLYPDNPETIHLKSLEQVVANFNMYGEPARFKVEFASSGPSDITLLVLKPLDSTTNLSNVGILPICNTPNVGPLLRMIGIEYHRDGFSHTSEGHVITIEMDVRTRIFEGQLKEVFSSKDEFLGSKMLGASFTTTFPIPHGFSGAPVIGYRPLCESSPHFRPFGNLGVSGVASYALDEDKDTNEPTHSVVTHIMNALALEIEPHGPTILDWMKQGKIPFIGLDPDRIGIITQDNVYLFNFR